MYFVRFRRKDKQPDEEYYYNKLADAQKHLDLFKDDDSGLYLRIDLFDNSLPQTKLLKSIVF